MKKLKYLMTTMILYIVSIPSVYAQTPGFNNEEAQEVAKKFLDPLTTFALWAIPAVALVVLVISGISWLSKDEDERENKPYIKTAKKIIFVAIVVESMPIILKIFGI